MYPNHKSVFSPSVIIPYKKETIMIDRDGSDGRDAFLWSFDNAHRSEWRFGAKSDGTGIKGMKGIKLIMASPSSPLTMDSLSRPVCFNPGIEPRGAKPYPFASSFAQESFSDTVRLNTGAPGRLSGSTAK